MFIFGARAQTRLQFVNDEIVEKTKVAELMISPAISYAHIGSSSDG